MKIIPATAVPTSDEEIGAMAGIETKRRAMKKETAKSHGAGAGHPGNVQAVTVETRRVKSLAVIAGQGPLARREEPAGPRQAAFTPSG